MKRRQVLIHSAYWLTSFLCFTLLYSFIDSMIQGVIYAGISLPLIIGVTYFFIYWAIPKLLFEERYLLFFLLSSTTLLGVLNIQIVFTLIQRIFLAEIIRVDFVLWDVFYLMIATVLFSLPVITNETLHNWSEKQKELTLLQQDKKEEYIEVKSHGKTHRIVSDDIVYIESFGDYAHIQLASEKIVTRMTLKRLNKQLSNFVRVHRSYIINPDFCKAFNLEKIVVKGKEIPVGSTYKGDVSEAFNHNRMAT